MTDGGGGWSQYTYTQDDVYVETGPAPAGENTKKRQLEYDGRLVALAAGEIVTEYNEMNSTELGHFSVLEKIGEGGMGQVFKARDTRLGRLVAIKLLTESRRADAARRFRFVQEARAASALNHPNIITIHEISEHEGQTFIVMELVDGKPLNELIPRKGIRLDEALRVGAQVADALASAHAAGIVHRDLKPANIMVDTHGRVKVLDFGLAKLFAPVFEADERTRTLVMDQLATEEGMIVGSLPYMSPEQAEGKVVDARSDIFSFGAVLYEMVTGQRAFRGESRVSTLASVIERDPPPPGEISPNTPPELERLIVRCLRKDINRRSQNMADVKVTLEELRQESESGTLTRPVQSAAAGARRWVWPAVAIASVLLAIAASIWILSLRDTGPKDPELSRVSPDDGHSYWHAAISPDGGFVAYISDRSGKDELWLQQVGGGDPIQLTHSSESVSNPSFFPDGKRILYISSSLDKQKSTIAVISTLGGEPKMLIQAGQIDDTIRMLSPDGRHIAYLESSPARRRLMIASFDGGRSQELSNAADMQGGSCVFAAWTPDSRFLLCMVYQRSQVADSKEFEWFAVPLDGGIPKATGAGDALRAAGLGPSAPVLMAGNHVLFYAGPVDRMNTWELRLSPGSWRVSGDPHQLTFGTFSEYPRTISATGTVALDIAKSSADLYLLPLSPATGQPAAIARRITHDGRHKDLSSVRGDSRNVYFSVWKTGSRDFRLQYYAVDLKSGKQFPLVAGLSLRSFFAVSPDGLHFAYSIPEAESFSIRVGSASEGVGDARVLCKACGRVLQFSADGKYIFHQREAAVRSDPKQKLTIRLLDVESGRDLPWLEHASDSVGPEIDTFGEDSGWVAFSVRHPGLPGPALHYVVRWKPEPVQPSEWIKVRPLGSDDVVRVAGNFFYFFQGSKFIAMRFNPRTGGFGEPFEGKFFPGSPATPTPDDEWGVRGPGMVFRREETDSSVWLMKAPR